MNKKIRNGWWWVIRSNRQQVIKATTNNCKNKNIIWLYQVPQPERIKEMHEFQLSFMDDGR